MKIGLGVYLWGESLCTLCTDVEQSSRCAKWKKDAVEQAPDFAQKVWGEHTHPRVFIYGSGLEGSSSAQATLGSTVPTLLWLFKKIGPLLEPSLLSKQGPQGLGLL